MKNYLKAEFDAKGINEGLARIIASGFIMPLDPTIEQMADVKTAVSEAVTNSIIHGYENRNGRVVLEFEIEERLLTIKVHDRGIGISDIAQARQPLYTSKPECDRSGMGFTVMESFMDSLHIISEHGDGTTVIMTKQF
ncbi:MAG: anti-sigma F factor [Ruminococcaceae bacterium]|nr:anti-sigma F factor [Oscillospiraceae bacterium]